MAETVVITPDYQVVSVESTLDIVQPAPTVHTVVVEPDTTTVVTHPAATNVSVAETELSVTVQPQQTVVVVSSGGGGGGGTVAQQVFAYWENGEAGAITLGQAVYLSSMSGIVRLAQADDQTTFDAVGLVAASSIPSNVVGAVILSGVLTGLSGLTPGRTYYLDPNTPGGITTTIPSIPGQYVIEIGKADTTTSIYVRTRLVVAL